MQNNSNRLPVCRLWHWKLTHRVQHVNKNYTLILFSGLGVLAVIYLFFTLFFQPKHGTWNINADGHSLSRKTQGLHLLNRSEGLTVVNNNSSDYSAKDKKNKQDTNNEDLLILHWGDSHEPHWYTNVMNYDKPLSCEETLGGRSSCCCTYTRNRTMLNESAALIGDVRKYRTNKYDRHQMPQYHLRGQYWVLFNSESMHPHETDHPILSPGLFNLSASYNTESDIYMPYGICMPRTKNWPVENAYINITQKKDAVLGYISNCRDERSQRLRYVNELKKYIDVDIRGRCGRDKGHLNVAPNYFGQNYLDTHKDIDEIKQYKFYLSFENAYCKDYVTEKVFKVLQDNVYTIPILRGYGPYNGRLPAHSYINTNYFNSARDLANYLKLLMSNDTLYREYFAWQKDTQCYNLYPQPNEWPCRVCRAICELRKSRQLKMLTNFDIFKFGICYLPN